MNFLTNIESLEVMGGKEQNPPAFFNKTEHIGS